MRTPEQTAADCAAFAQRVTGHIDILERYMAEVMERFRSDGIIRDTNARERVGDEQ